MLNIISNLQPSVRHPDERVALPESHTPFFLRELKSDSHATSLQRLWISQDDEEKAVAAFRAIGSGRIHALKGAAPGGHLRYQTSLKAQELLGNFIFSYGLLFVSDPVMTVIRQFDTRNLEFFPVEIALSGRRVEIVRSYWMINFVAEEEIIDFEASEIEYVLKRDGLRMITKFNRLELSGPPSGLGLYRIGGFLNHGFIHSDLSRALTQSGLLESSIARQVKSFNDATYGRFLPSASIVPADAGTLP